MKRMISLFLTVTLLIGSICSAKAAAADDNLWICSQCGRENKASYAFCPSCGTQRDVVCAACGYVFAQDEFDFAFCPSCGTQRMEVSADKPEQDSEDSSYVQAEPSKGKEPSQGKESSSDMLPLYYKNAMIGGFSEWKWGDNKLDYSPYLSIVTRLKDGIEETSCLAVAVYDLSENSLVIWGDSGLLSEGCEYEWQCNNRSYPVVISSSKAAVGLIAFKLKEDDDLEVIDHFKIMYAACPYFGFGEYEGELKLVYFGVDEPHKRLVAKKEWAKVLGFEDHTTYQTIALADYEGYADTYYIYCEEIEEASSLWGGGGICGVLINKDGSICGIHVAGVGMVSLLALNDENFYNVANSTRKSIPTPTDVFGVSLLRTEDLGGITCSVYELPEGYKSSQAIYAKYLGSALNEGFPCWYDLFDEQDGVVILNAYELEEENMAYRLEEENMKALLYAIKDEGLVVFEQSDPNAESNPWQEITLGSIWGGNRETYPSTRWSLE